MFKPHNSKALSGISLALLLSGCAITADHGTLTTPNSTAMAQLATAASNPVASHFTKAAWWRAFDDAELNQLVIRALQNNRDLQASALRLEASMARLNVSQDQLRPQGGLSGSAALARSQTAYTGRDVLRQENLSLGLTATWQLDLFGRIRARIRQAEAELEEQSAAQSQVLAEVISGVVETHTRLAGTERQLRLLERQLISLEESLDVMQLRVEEGIATPLELNRTQALLHEYRARRPELEATRAGYLETLATLVGANSRELTRGYVAVLPQLNALMLNISDPEQALLNAPELRQAQARVVRAMALSDQARASLYPEVSISGVLGWLSGSTLALGDLSKDLEINPQLSWSLLNLSALRASLSAAQLEERAVLAEYENSLLQVLNRADRAITAWGARGRLLAEMNARQRFSDAAFDQARARYEEGVLPYMDYLDAQRELLASESTLVEAQTAWLVSYVTLQQAFPGHWVPFLPEQK